MLVKVLVWLMLQLRKWCFLAVTDKSATGRHRRGAQAAGAATSAGASGGTSNDEQGNANKENDGDDYDGIGTSQGVDSHRSSHT